MKLLDMFKRKTQQNDSNLKCVNLSTANDCSLVSEIKGLQNELERVELTIKSLRDGRLDNTCLIEVFNFFSSDYCYRAAQISRYNKNYLDTAEAALIFSDAFRDLNIDEFVKEITILHDRNTIIYNKEQEAATLRKKIMEAKDALGIK